MKKFTHSDKMLKILITSDSAIISENVDILNCPDLTRIKGGMRIFKSSRRKELRSDFQESLLPPKPGMYAEKVATAPKAM